MSQLNPSEISSVLKEKISGLDLSSEKKNEGVIVSVSDGIVRLHGMGDVMYGELIEFENGVLGFIAIPHFKPFFLIVLIKILGGNLKRESVAST